MKKIRNITWLFSALALGMVSCDWQINNGAYKETWQVDPHKDTIVINNANEPSSLDPQQSNGAVESSILRVLFEGLTKVDEYGNAQPALAESWQDKDKKLWLFHLRKDARWSNGEPVTAHDVVYSWRRLANPATGSPVTSALTDVAVRNAKAILSGKAPLDSLGIYALDDHTLQVILEKPVPFFLQTLDSVALAPLPVKVIEREGKHWTQAGHMISNGPYYLKEWHINNSILLVRNHLYWNNSHTKNNRLRFLPISSATSDVINYMSGREDVSAGALPPEMYAKIKANYPHELNVAPMACVEFLDVNLRHPPFNDQRVRLALTMSLPREILVSKVLGQGQKISYTVTPDFIKGMHFLVPYWAKWSEQKRIERAKQLLKEAGYNKNHPLEFELLYNTTEKNRQQILTVANEWTKRLSVVKVRLRNIEWKTYLAALYTGDYEMVRRGTCANYNDPSSFLLAYLSDSPDNTDGYKSARYNAAVYGIFAKNLSSKDLMNRYQQAEAILMEDVPSLIMYTHVQSRLIKGYVKGFKPTITGNIDWDQLWLNKDKKSGSLL